MKAWTISGRGRGKGAGRKRTQPSNPERGPGRRHLAPRALPSRGTARANGQRRALVMTRNVECASSPSPRQRAAIHRHDSLWVCSQLLGQTSGHHRTSCNVGRRWKASESKRLLSGHAQVQTARRRTGQIYGPLRSLCQKIFSKLSKVEKAAHTSFWSGGRAACMHERDVPEMRPQVSMGQRREQLI